MLPIKRLEDRVRTGALLPGGLFAVAVTWLAAGAAESSSPVSGSIARTTTSPTAPVGRGAVPVYLEWHTFTTRDGLPSDKVYAVRVDGDRIWAGTDAGLAY